MTMPVANARITNAFFDLKMRGYYAKTSSNPYGDHTGIDLTDIVTFLAPIYATLDGRIHFIGDQGRVGWGKYVILEVVVGGKKYHIIHAHLSLILVKLGQTVKAGQQIAVMGTSGNSTGVHLHYEVRLAPWEDKKYYNASAFLGIINERGLARMIPVQAEFDPKAVPKGANITPLNGGGWIEYLPDRVITHFDAYTYTCLWHDGKFTIHAKDKPVREL